MGRVTSRDWRVKDSCDATVTAPRPGQTVGRRVVRSGRLHRLKTRPAADSVAAKPLGTVGHCRRDRESCSSGRAAQSRSRRGLHRTRSGGDDEMATRAEVAWKRRRDAASPGVRRRRYGRSSVEAWHRQTHVLSRDILITKTAETPVEGVF